MHAKLTVILLDADGAAVAWGQTQATMRGNGGLYVDRLTLIADREAPVVAQLVHWPDLGVGHRLAYAVPAIPVGHLYTLEWHGRPILQFPPCEVPPLTLQPHHGTMIVSPGCGSMAGVA